MPEIDLVGNAADFALASLYLIGAISAGIIAIGFSVTVVVRLYNEVNGND